MGKVRVLLACAHPDIKKIKSLVYRLDATRGRLTTIPTSAHPRRDCLAIPRYPGFEQAIGDAYPLQEAWVTIEDPDGTEYRFLIAAQYSPTLPVNRALSKVMDATPWRGELIVMRGGTAVSVVNMGRPAFYERAERAVRKFLLESAPLVTHAIQTNVPLDLPTHF